VSQDVVSNPGTVYSDFDDVEIKRAGVDYDLSSVGGDSQYARRDKGAAVIRKQQPGEDEGLFHYDEDEELQSNNNYNYYKDHKEDDEPGGSYSMKGRGDYLRSSDVIKNVDYDDNMSARSSESGFYKKRAAVVGGARFDD
jgi:hypothetical protein